MKLTKTLMTSLLAGSVAFTGLIAPQAHANSHAGEATYSYKDPNTNKMVTRVAKSNTYKDVKKDVKSNAAQKVKSTTYVDPFRGYPTITTRDENGELKEEVSDVYKEQWLKERKEKQSFSKTIYFWYHGKKYKFVYHFKK